MAKRDTNRSTGRLAESITKRRRNILEINMNQITMKIREEEKLKKEKSLGPRKLIIKAYKKNENIEDAYKLVEELNNKFGRIVYTRETVDNWINEELETNSKKGKGIDDDDDAR